MEIHSKEECVCCCISKCAGLRASLVAWLQHPGELQAVLLPRRERVTKD